MLFDFVENGAGVEKNGVILKSNDSDILVFEELGSFAVVFYSFFCEMMGAVEFNSQAFTGAIEVENVPAYTVLSSEFSSVEFFVLEKCPQKCFCLRAAIPQRFSEVFKI